MSADRRRSGSDEGGTKDHKMGVVSCSSYVIGNIIGSGIFITTNSVAQDTNSVGLTLLIWAVCAAISFLGAIVYVELATSIPDPGADYAYAMKVGWKAIAFGFMLVSVCITFPASAAVQSITFGQYMEKFISVLLPVSLTSEDPTESTSWIVICLALLLLVSLTILNFFSLDKIASTFQNIVSVCKLLSVAAIIAIGFYFLIFKGETQNFNNMFAGSNWDIGTMTMAVYGGLWSYAGWDILNYGTPEIRNPRSTMPLSLFFGLGVVASAYILINVSFFTVLTLEEVQNSTAIGDASPWMHPQQQFPPTAAAAPPTSQYATPPTVQQQQNPAAPPVEQMQQPLALQPQPRNETIDLLSDLFSSTPVGPAPLQPTGVAKENQVHITHAPSPTTVTVATLSSEPDTAQTMAPPAAAATSSTTVVRPAAAVLPMQQMSVQQGGGGEGGREEQMLSISGATSDEYAPIGVNGEGKTRQSDGSSSLTSLLDASTFSIGEGDSQRMAKKQLHASIRGEGAPPTLDPNDPLNQLDPFWKTK